MEQNKIPKYIPWDKIHSTYYWKIHLKPEFRYNGVEFLVGYSKKCNQNEAIDKVQMLKTKIFNLYKNSYLNRAAAIEIFKREGSVIDTKNDNTIMILYGSSYNIPEDQYEVMFKLFGLFLNDFYYRIKAQKSMDGLLPKAKVKRSLDEMFDVTKQHFENLDHLNNRAGYLISTGFPYGQVTSFVQKYRQAKGW